MITRYFEADVSCMHCGHVAGTLRRPGGVSQAPSTFRALDGGSPLAVQRLSTLRCRRCQGPLYAEEFQARYEHPRVDFSEDRPRRGRPPKWLVEARQAAAAATELAG